MGDKNLNDFQNQDNRLEPKVQVSKDGKWIIIRRDDIEQPIIKAVAYFEKIIETAKKRTYGTSVEKVKG